MSKSLTDEFLFYTIPHFSQRYFLRKDIGYVVKKYKLKGKLLDVGCGEKPYKFLFKNTKYLGIDFPNFSPNKSVNIKDEPNICFPENYKLVGKLPFQDNTFDIVCAFQVFEHVTDPFILFDEMVRILKRNGYLLITAPFLWALHEEPNDHFRFTRYTFDRLIKLHHCRLHYYKKQGGLLSAIETLLENYLVELNQKNKLYYFLTLPLYIPLLLLSYLAVLVENYYSSKSIYINNLFLIKK